MLSLLLYTNLAGDEDEALGGGLSEKKPLLLSAQHKDIQMVPMPSQQPASIITATAQTPAVADQAAGEGAQIKEQIITEPEIAADVTKFSGNAVIESTTAETGRESVPGNTEAVDIGLDAAPVAGNKAVTDTNVAAEGAVQLDIDPFADGSDAGGPSSEISEEDMKAFPGIEILGQLGITVPPLAFKFDDSDEAKDARLQSSVAQYVSEGLPEEVAKLKAQLTERELQGKALRAKHSRKRTIVRLIQEAKLKKDAVARDARMQLLQMKQESVQKQMAEEAKAKEEAEQQKEEERKQRDAKLAEERRKLTETKEMMAKLRMDAVLKLQEENAARKKEEKESKRADAIEREERDRKEKESKRKMMEDFQAQMQAQLEDQKRLAREERLKEAADARAARLQMEENLGLKKPLVGTEAEE